MKVMIFVDADNFKGIRRLLREEGRGDRWIDFYKLNLFVIEYLGKNKQYKDCKLQHIRTYCYTGEYTPHLIKKIKDALENAKEEKKEFFRLELTKAEQGYESQKAFFKDVSTYYFFEMRKKPLQFSPTDGVFQKGVDVQLAVDLVTNAHLKTFDIAVVFSGDIDLIESVRSVKNLGKHVIIFSHYKNTAKDMVTEADMFVDFQRFDDELLNKFTHIFQRRETPTIPPNRQKFPPTTPS
ncbi:MAG TPA: hypothetical protein DER04_02320 [Holosporales bacterium]|nr:hypothetical protein [Holosporales bacterium]